jgi:hypothetical protein
MASPVSCWDEETRQNYRTRTRPNRLVVSLWGHHSGDGKAACNQLLADGWVLLGIFPVTLIGEMTEGEPRNGQQRKQPQDTQRYVRQGGYGGQLRKTTARPEPLKDTGSA